MKLNPFSSHCIRPADCRFVLPPDLPIREEQSMDSAINDLKEQFLQIGTAAQIVGPHGCGKSTLALKIAGKLTTEFSSIQCVTLRLESRPNLLSIFAPLSVHWNLDCPDSDVVVRPQPTANRLLIMDGVELLSLVNRRLLLRSCLTNHTSILLTTHRVMAGVDILVQLKPLPDHFKQIVDQLQSSFSHQLTPEQIYSGFHDFKGDYRLALRYLYDVYESETQSLRSKLAS